MMKRIFLFLIPMLLMAACTPKQQEPEALPVLELSNDIVVIPCTGGNASVDVKATNSWNADISSGADWITISSTSQGVDIEAASTKAHIGRMGSVTVVSGQLKKVISICQTMAPITDKITLPVESFAFESDASSKTVTIGGNVPWTANCSDPWVTVSPASGDAGATVTVTVTKNSEKTIRNSQITFSGGEALPAKIDVSQSGSNVSFQPAGVLATWKCNDPAYLEAHSPDWSTYGANDYSHGSGKGIALPDDGGYDGATITWVYAGNHSFPIVYITAAEGHIAAKAAGNGDGFLFSFPGINLRKGTKVRLDCAVAGIAQSPKNWVAKFRLSNLDDWVVGDSPTSKIVSSGAVAHMSCTGAKDYSASAQFMATYTVAEDTFGADLQVFVCAADAATISKAITSGAVVRLIPLVGTPSSAGPVVSLE